MINDTLALDVHEEGVGALNEALLLVHELLLGGARVKKVGNQLKTKRDEYQV